MKNLKLKIIVPAMFILLCFALAGCAPYTPQDASVNVDKDVSVNKAQVDSVNASQDDSVDNFRDASVNTVMASDEKELDTESDAQPDAEIKYYFRNEGLLTEHFEKHGQEFPYETKEDYLLGANIMLNNPDKLHKKEKEDNDDVYYLEETNEFIIVSLDGYIRTYFKPTKGKKYFDNQ